MRLFLLAFKSVFRNKRRSILNICALCLGMVVMFLGLGWVNGYHTYIYKSLMDFDTGSAQILNREYQDQARRYPLDLTVPDYARFREQLAENPDIDAVAGRINFIGTMSARGNSVTIGVSAVDPTHEAEVTVLQRQIVEGEYLVDGEGGLLLGRPLADKLKIGVGEVLFLSAVDKDGVVNLIDLPVVGLFSYGYPMMDEGQVFITLDSAWALLGLEDEVTRIVLSLSDSINPLRWVERHQSDWAETGLAVYDWKIFASTAVSAVESDSISFYVVLVIIYILTTIGMLNSMSMSMHERTREFGTLRAIGMKNRSLLLIITFEGISIALISMVFAMIISAPLVYLLQGIGFSFGEIMDGGLPIPFGERFRADFRVWQAVLTMGTAIVAAAIGSVLPARRIAKKTIARSLGGEGVF